MEKSGKIVFILIILVILAAGGFVFINTKTDFFVNMNKKNDFELDEIVENKNDIELEDEIKNTEKNIKIFNGNDRPIAFMIDNNINAQPQSAINKAYAVYEIIVEGGETRLMACFKGIKPELVGPIRSSRHYFLDYAMENDAIYAHLGWSPEAQSDISIFKINNINGQNYDTGKAKTENSLYWRSSKKKAPHNAYTNVPSIIKIAKDKGYRITSNESSVLNYVEEDFDLDQDDIIIANEIVIPYTTSHKVKYVYDNETKRYTRFSKGKMMKDGEDLEPITTKNIIITFAKNVTLNDGENKGRQDVKTVGTLDGYYITNGKAIKIYCIKLSRDSKTIYKTLGDQEIQVNDGNTWINVCPIDSNVIIKE